MKLPPYGVRGYATKCGFYVACCCTVLGIVLLIGIGLPSNGLYLERVHPSQLPEHNMSATRGDHSSMAYLQDSSSMANAHESTTSVWDNWPSKSLYGAQDTHEMTTNIPASEFLSSIKNVTGSVNDKLRNISDSLQRKQLTSDNSSKALQSHSEQTSTPGSPVLGVGNITQQSTSNSGAPSEEDTKQRSQTTKDDKVTDIKLNMTQNVSKSDTNEKDKNLTLPRANVLMIVTDDMRPDIGVYASSDRPWLYPHMYTPNLDKMAAQSLLFQRAYCVEPLCNPSRTALLTSRRPDTTGVINNLQPFRASNPLMKTIPEVFKSNGYVTMSMGKIVHPLGSCDDRKSWTLPCYLPYKVINESPGGWRAVSEHDRQGRKLMDEQTIDFASKNLERLAIGAKDKSKPFFVALGIKQPHVPFDFPEEFLKYYPSENVSLPANPSLPKNVPDMAWKHKHWRTQNAYLKSKTAPIHGMPNASLHQFRRAFYASISYVDKLVGDILKKLDELELSNNTIVVFVSDHGVHMGEHGILGKKTQYEINAQVPLIIRVPRVTDGGLVTRRLVELVDLFPTLVDLVGLPPLQLCPESESKSVPQCTEGTSLLPLFKNPKESKWKDRIFYQYPIEKSRNDKCMGYTVLNGDYRYTEWVHTDTINKGKVCDEEMYDLRKDIRETVNCANDTQYKDAKEDLRKQLHLGWRAALPT